MERGHVVVVLIMAALLIPYLSLLSKFRQLDNRHKILEEEGEHPLTRRVVMIARLKKIIYSASAECQQLAV